MFIRPAISVQASHRLVVIDRRTGTRLLSLPLASLVSTLSPLFGAATTWPHYVTFDGGCVTRPPIIKVELLLATSQ